MCVCVCVLLPLCVHDLYGSLFAFFHYWQANIDSICVLSNVLSKPECQPLWMNQKHLNEKHTAQCNELRIKYIWMFLFVYTLEFYTLLLLFLNIHVKIVVWNRALLIRCQTPCTIWWQSAFLYIDVFSTFFAEQLCQKLPSSTHIYCNNLIKIWIHRFVCYNDLFTVSTVSTFIVNESQNSD